ncbi:winged helix-turn-helix transcriptional regulator [Rhodococcus zopfii]|uniref:Helix-turn-helix transcriptional regulator n=1 Tax=Rhodococcus zopfii TaxID=43772 RepID=A0ABU3WQ70_9NOCA|nr:helix-turn-helix domain-containing protein [Rhodococcus zopfii]MDV2475897.1 helix-turn-helix transcriptional regulator [Rhodococcus zopfii]
MTRRSYGHYCTVGKALDSVGDRWSLLVVRELCGGPRRYSDLFADLPGISTDMLAARLRDLESDGIVERRRIGPRAGASVYELTESGRRLRPVLDALSAWGTDRLDGRADTDAVRAHWLAFPLGRAIAAHLALDPPTVRTVNIRIGTEPAFHIVVTTAGITHRDGDAPSPDAELRVDLSTAVELARGTADIGPLLERRAAGTELEHDA